MAFTKFNEWYKKLHETGIPTSNPAFLSGYKKEGMKLGASGMAGRDFIVQAFLSLSPKDLQTVVRRMKQLGVDETLESKLNMAVSKLNAARSESTPQTSHPLKGTAFTKELSRQKTELGVSATNARNILIQALESMDDNDIKMIVTKIKTLMNEFPALKGNLGAAVSRFTAGREE